MKDFNVLPTYVGLAELYPYYKADVFAACLIEAGVNPEQIIITRKNGMGQGMLYDIEKVSIKYPYLHADSPVLNVESGRPGIYDALPENLFYAADHSYQERDKNQILQRMKTNRETEKNVRRFFRLFEVEADAFRCHIQTEELKYDKKHTYDEFVAVFEQYWEILSLMERYEALRFLEVVPHIATMRGSYKAAAAAVAFIMNIRVAFEPIITMREVKEKPAPLLSDMILGENSVLGMGDAKKPEETVHITVSELEQDACADFFEGKDREKVLRYLAELFLETNTPIRIVINPRSEYREFFLGKSGREAYLDVNTYL